MWSPTHVQVTVQKASGLLTKGKNDSNDCFVTIALGKVKYQTSVKEKADANVEWHEECELPIPDQGNTAEIVLTALHRNFLGVDEFLGRVNIPLSDFDVYERPKNHWYTLKSKPGKDSNKERGKLEVKIAFTVKSGSLSDLSKKEKHKSSMGQLSHMAQSVGGSLLSIGSIDKRKGIKKFAKSLGSKMHLKGKKKSEGDDESSIGSVGSLKRRTGVLEKRSFTEDTPKSLKSSQKFGDADPGVISEDDDDFTFDELSHKSSGSSLNQISNNPSFAVVGGNTTGSQDNIENDGIRKSTPPIKPPRAEVRQDEWEQKLYGGKLSKNNLYVSGNTENLNRRSRESSKLTSQPEEDESALESNTTVTNNNTTPAVTNELIIKEDASEKNKSPNMPKKDVKEKESMLQKLKHFRKGIQDKSDLSDSKLLDTSKSLLGERIIIGGETNLKMKSSPRINRISNEILEKYDGYSREDLILQLLVLQGELDLHKKKTKDLEDYLDDLLLRVMETTPKLLQNPYIGCKFSHAKLR